MSSGTAANEKKAVAGTGLLELVEDDDEFEEFDTTNWELPSGNAKEENMWQGDWDDEVGNEDFVNQLRREYASGNSPAPTAAN